MRMTTGRLGLAALALVAMTLVLDRGAHGQSQGGTVRTDWHTLTGPDKSFTADMPAGPKYTATQMKTGAGTKYTMHQYLLEQGEIAFVVQSAVYPTEVNVSNPRANLQGGLDNAAKNMDGGKWASIDWTTHQGLTAVGAVGVRSGHAIRSFSVLKGRQIFTLTYAGPTGTAQSPDAEQFVGSLRVGGP